MRRLPVGNRRTLLFVLVSPPVVRHTLIIVALCVLTPLLGAARVGMLPGGQSTLCLARFHRRFLVRGDDTLVVVVLRLICSR